MLTKDCHDCPKSVFKIYEGERGAGVTLFCQLTNEYMHNKKGRLKPPTMCLGRLKALREAEEMQDFLE